MLKKLSNYKIFLLSNSFFYFGWGLFLPFWVLFIQEYGGLEQFGIAFGILTLTQSITSYYCGKYSDKLGRKSFLVVTGFFYTGIIFAYTFIQSTLHLYILQAIYGVVEAMFMTMETTYLGDLTTTKSRGLNVGKYKAIVGVMSAAAMAGAGYIASIFGKTIIFYVTAIIMLIATLVLFFLKE